MILKLAEGVAQDKPKQRKKSTHQKEEEGPILETKKKPEIIPHPSMEPVKSLKDVSVIPEAKKSIRKRKQIGAASDDIQE